MHTSGPLTCHDTHAVVHVHVHVCSVDVIV